MSTPFPTYDVLISYSTRRKEAAQDIADALKSEGFSVWMAPASIPAGSDYPDEIYAAIDNSRMILFVLCEESLRSEWCANELRFAIAQNKKILPAQITDVQNPYAEMRAINRRLSKKQIFSLYPEYKARIDALLTSSKALLFDDFTPAARPYPKDSYDYDEYAAFFTGRDEEIASLHDLLAQKRIVNLYGMGGIGKTALMRRYFAVYEEADAYHSMHVAPYVLSLADTLARIPFAGFDDEAYLNNLEKAPGFSRTQALFEKKLDLLAHLSSECLLVLDGADGYTEEELAPLTRVGCSVIITSRTRYSIFTPFPLAPMSEEALTAMFFAYARAERSKDEEQAVHAVIKKVQGHTLTVKMLACYCYDTGMSASELTGEDFLSSLEEYETDTEKISSLFRVSELSEQERYALSVLALFPDGISKGKLQKIERAPLRTLPALAKRGWVIASDNAYALHPIIAQCVRTNCPMTTDALRPFLTSFAEIFRDIGIDNASLHAVARRIFSSVTGDDFLCALLYHRIGTFIGDYTYADTFRISLDVYENQDMNFYNRVNEECVGFDCFEECYIMNERALAIAEKLPEQNHDFNAFVLSCMGSARFNQNNFDRALAFQRRALAEVEKSGTEDNPVLLIVLNRLGLTALETGDTALAEQSFSRYLTVAQRYHPRTANPSMALFNLGNLAYRRGDWERAEEYYLASEQLNPDDKATSFGLSELWLRLALLCRKTQRSDRAKQYFLQCRAVKETVLTDKKDFYAFTEKFDKLFL